MKFLIKVFIVLNVFSKVFAADSGLNPQYLNIKFYKLAVSESQYCTNLQTIIDVPQGESFDFLSQPMLGTGSVAVGEYPCIVIEFSDYIHFAPDQNSTTGNCAVGVEVSEEICQRVEDDIKYIDGTTSSCVDGQEQKIALYLSTASTSNGGDGTESPFTPPTANELNRGLNLGAALNVDQGLSAKFIVNALGKVEDAENRCRFSAPPLFSFEKIVN